MRLLVALSAMVLAGCGFVETPSALDLPAPAASKAARLDLPTAAPTTAGCGIGEPVAAGTSARFVNHEGVDRRYLLHVPDGYRPGVPTPAVVSMHGLGSNADEQMLLTGIAANADQHGYVVIAPEASGGIWNLPVDNDTSVDSPEFQYLDAVLADAGAQLCLDPARQYASGMSMGSAMALALACAPDRKFAAFGGVGASFYRAVCDATPPAPLIYFHGTDDPIVPHAGGLAQGVPVASVPTVMADWAKHNGCSPDPTSERTGDVDAVQWQQCRLGADVDYYEVLGGGHTWPGAPSYVADAIEPRFGITSESVDATEAMWAFFSRFTLPSGSN